MAATGDITWSSIDQVKAAELELRRGLAFLTNAGMHQFAATIVTGLHADFAPRTQDRPAAVKNPLPAPPAPSSSSTRRDGELRRLDIDARDISARAVKQRALRKAVVEDVILIFLALNRQGVVPADVAAELERLNLKEPAGTTASRIARMRAGGDVQPYSNANPGFWLISEKGYAEADKAAKKRGVNAAL